MSPSDTPTANDNVESVRRSAYVADDDAVTRDLLKSMLRLIGLRVLGESADGKRALYDISSLKPDVVCLDMEMPSMTGLEVLVQLRADQNEVVVLLITGSPTADVVKQAIEARADGIIAKPFSQAKVSGEIERAFSRRAHKS